MKVILKKDVPPLGHAGDIKEVSLGYGRNYLLPKGLAQAATLHLVEQAKLRQIKQESEREVQIKHLKQLAEQLVGMVLEIKLSAGERGQVFESVGTKQISEILKVKGLPISSDQIDFKPTKKTGEHEATVKLGQGISERIKVQITK